MKILISADMEGTCGVSSWTQVTPPEYGEAGSSGAEYERARLRMTREVNAAIEGAFDGGASEVIVNDSHDGMRNLIAEELDPRCRFITGNDKPLGMTQGVDLDGISGLFFTGYHAKAGTPNAPLAHTWTGWVNDVRVNGISTGEFGINAIVAGHFGVPVVFAAGDEKAVEQVKAWSGDQVVTVAVKEGLSTFAALHLHPTRAQELIREAAKAAAKKAKRAKPYLLPENSLIEVDFDHQTRADQAIYVPGVTRGGERTVVYRPTDGLDFIYTWRAVTKAASVRMMP
jgi:D-amino peptidase